MSAVAQFVQGCPLMVDYTPAAAVTAGDVVILGNGTLHHFGIAHHDIAAGDLGALSVGPAVYDVLKNASDSFLQGQPVPFNNTSSKADSGLVIGGTNSNTVLGYALADAGTSATTVRVHVIAKPDQTEA